METAGSENEKEFSQKGEQLRVAFETLGCRSNYADTIDLQAALVERGAVPCEFSEAADVYVINTCTVTDGADKEAYRLIRKAHERSPGARIVVTGCLAEVGSDELFATGKVNSVIGPGRRDAVLGAILGRGELSRLTDRTALVKAPTRRVKKSLPVRHSISLADPISPEIAGPGTYLGEVKSRARYHLRIQEGCENSCTFCIIPQTRGLLSSRSLKDLKADFQHLAAVGYNEIVLTGTHIGGYGEDTGSSLSALLQEIAAWEFGPRVRLSSIDPNDLSCEIVDLIAKGHVFCNHLHICVQAFSDSVLKRMNRRYRLGEVFEIISYIEEQLPGCCIGSDLITGFPGESREEVEKEIEVFLSLPISYLHVFPYSERSDTPAVRLDGAVDKGERARRAARWRALSERRRATFLQSLVGAELEFIVEGFDDDFLYGTSREYAAVKTPQRLFVSGDSPVTKLLGKRVIVRALTEDNGSLLCE